ncbi:DnaJ domain-containing protein, partial [Hyaloraphidium curvatum]
HYAVLGLDHSAGADEIRAAYKRQALLWHPDRHSGSADGDAGTAATERFKRVQEAYEVLSDPAEKRWYDLHREEILSGRRSPGSSEGGWGAGSAWIDVHDLYRWFSPTCYKGFEGPGSFYDVYGKLFAALQEEE